MIVTFIFFFLFNNRLVFTISALELHVSDQVYIVLQVLLECASLAESQIARFIACVARVASRHVVFTQHFSIAFLSSVVKQLCHVHCAASHVFAGARESLHSNEFDDVIYVAVDCASLTNSVRVICQTARQAMIHSLRFRKVLIIDEKVGATCQIARVWYIQKFAFAAAAADATTGGFVFNTFQVNIVVLMAMMGT